jgi:ribosomal peptide maturation radical SAM protein 1
MGDGECDVVLVTMPFGPLLQPSLALSLLRDVTAATGARVRVEYLNIDFAVRLGAESYVRLAEGEPSPSVLAGEWVFAGALFPEAAEDAEAYLGKVLAGALDVGVLRAGSFGDVDDGLRRRLALARSLVERFLDDAAARVLSWNPSVVGFSSVFQQHIASLALAERLKRASPAIVVVFGGANCEGSMGDELLARFQSVDAVVPGEGERVLPALVERVLARASYDDVPGVVTRRAVPSSTVNNVDLIDDLDDLPEVQFDDYFGQLEDAALDLPSAPRLLFESSRGCWWGQRVHCTFCGLNGKRMRFRSKSPQRVLAELQGLRARHPGLPIGAVDNILEMSYFSTVLPALAAAGGDLGLFYEVKANLRKEHVRLLRDAGVRDIQPGIESLADGVLRLMRKGVSALQNIQLLKWCVELGVRPVWNVLWGFPGEDPQEYERMAELVPLLTHLPPPSSAGPVRIDRFSPLFEDPDAHGLEPVEPVDAYRYLYPFPPESVARLAYYFRTPGLERESSRYAAPLRAAIASWQAAHDTSALFSVDSGDRLWLWDLRPAARSALTELDGLQRVLYLECDGGRTVKALEQATPGTAGRRRDEPVEALRDLVDRGLMVERNGVYLALAVPVGEYRPSSAAMARLAAAL